MYVSIFIYHIFFIHCLGWTFGLTSLILAIVTSATKNLMVHQSFQVSAFIFFSRYIPRRRIARSYGSSVFNFFRTTILFHITCVILHSHQLYSRDPIFPHPSSTCCFPRIFSFLFAMFHTEYKYNILKN